MTVADDHEVLPNAPLALVAVEVRLPSGGSGRPLPMTVQRAFRDVLGEGWVIQSSRVQPVSLTIGPGGAVPQAMPPITVQSFTVRDRTMAVALTEESITVQTTRYRHYPDFRETLSRAVQAAASVLAPDGIARVGMRYIDEIRVPGTGEGDTSGWAEWVDTSLVAPKLGPMAQAGFPVGTWEGAAQYLTGSYEKLVLRFGARAGYAVNPDGPLKRPDPPRPGPFFMLDFDSFWEPPEIPEFEPTTIMAVCDRLRAPVRALFDMLVTERLLAEFRKEKSVG
jgi:uncharacterized protein (TIGR04255 family)